MESPKRHLRTMQSHTRSEQSGFREVRDCHVSQRLPISGKPHCPTDIQSMESTHNREVPPLENVELIQYADDLTFVFKDRDFVPFWVAKEIVRKIEELGFTVNREKLELFSAKSKWAILGLHKCNTQKTEGIKARKTRKLKSKLRLFEHLRSKGAQFTRRLNKLGNPISIDQMEKGLRNWLAVTESLNTLSDLDITKYLNDCQTKSYTIFDFGKNISGRGKRRRKGMSP